MELLEDDVFEILDPNNALPLIEVADEWYDWAKAEFETIFEIDSTKFNEDPLSVVLLRTLRVAIDYYEYCRVIYMHEQPLGGIHEDDFPLIAQTLFDAASIGHFFTPAFSNANQKQYIRHIHIGNRPLFGTVGSLIPIHGLNLSIQGRQYLRQQLGALTEPPEIEPDEFEDYNPYSTIDDQISADKTEVGNSVAMPSSNLKKIRRAGPGKPPDYTDAEKNSILQQYKMAQADGEKRDAFIGRIAGEQEKPVQEIRKMLEAAERGARRKGQK